MAIASDTHSQRGARIVVHDDCYANVSKPIMEKRIEHMRETAYRMLESHARAKEDRAAAEATKSER